MALFRYPLYRTILREGLTVADADKKIAIDPPPHMALISSTRN